jgi:hypothetical protein
MKLDTNILDELINSAPIELPHYKFYIPELYTEYPNEYKGHKVIIYNKIKDNSIYFGNFEPTI